MKITIAEIAKMAGVSKTTVSRVINEKLDVLPETRDRINALIRQYDFHPNAYAKAITNRKSNTIGLVIAQSANYVFSNPYYAEIIRGVSNMAQSRGYHLLLTYCEGGDYIEVVRQKRVDGVILISPTAQHGAVIEKLEELELPFISASRMPGYPDIHYICVDDVKGCMTAVNYLISLGHRAIGFINGPEGLASSQDRLAGYRKILTESRISIQPDWIQEGDTSIDSGFYCMQTLIAKTNVTAVFIASDLMAIGAIRAIEEAGKSVPGDYSIIGFDDIPLAGFLKPSLTTMRQDTFEKGQTAARMLLDLLNGNPHPNPVIMTAELIIRQSTHAI